MKRLLIESLLVALAGTLLSLAANSLSPRGLHLGRDYFPRLAGGPAPLPLVNTATNGSLGTNATGSSAALRELSARLQAQGLSLAESNQVIQWFRDPGRAQGLVVFVDARDDKNYQAGHIPGAYQLDYYRPEKYLPEVLQVVATARTVIVYCNGGNCEDSEFAARMLGTAIPKDRIHVYAGGFAEWQSAGMPVETGPRQNATAGSP